MRPDRRQLMCVAAGLFSTLLFLPAGSQVKITEVMDLRAAFPLGGREGSTVPVTLVGKHIDGPTRLLVEGEGIEVHSLTGKSSTLASAELRIVSGAAPGPRYLRLVGRFGITDPVPFLVGKLPESREQEPNNTASQANPTAFPQVVNGRFDPAEDVDTFRFAARSGQSLVLAVESYALDATHSVGEGRGRRIVDPVMRVLDARGNTVAECEDFHTPDPLLVFRAPRDGEYCVEVRDLGYEGYAAAAYRLTLTPDSWATSLYPAGGRRGTAVPVEVRAADGSSHRRQVEVGSGAAPVRYLSFAALSPNERPFLVGDLPETLEAEPNDIAAQANAVTVGSVFNGRIGSDGDVDAFRLELAQGEAVSVEVLAEQLLHSPLDLTLTVLDEQGKQLAHNDDSKLEYALESSDPALHFAAPAPGRYTFVLKDVAGRGEPDGVYRVTVNRLRKGFHLTTWWDNVVLKGAGGTGAFLALVRREHGFRGPVRVRVRGLPPGYHCPEAIVTAPLSTALMTITAPSDAQPGTVVPFWLEGEAEVEGKPLIRRAVPRAQRDQDGETIWRPSNGCLAAVAPVTEFQLHTEVRALTATAGETLHIPVKIDRIAGYEEAFTLNAVQCVFSLGGSPAQFRATVPVPKGGREVDFSLPLPEGLPAGDYTFALVRGMGHDFRIDRPYPSTPLIRLTVRRRDQ